MAKNAYHEHLKSVPLFADLDRHELDVLASASTELRLPAGRVLMTQGRTAHEMFVVINIQNLSAVAVPDNRGGAVSSVMSFRFFGHAAGPVMWLPVFDRSPEAAFLGVGALGLVTTVALVGAAVRITGGKPAIADE